jgi:hypothetical protein
MVLRLIIDEPEFVTGVYYLLSREADTRLCRTTSWGALSQRKFFRMRLGPWHGSWQVVTCIANRQHGGSEEACGMQKKLGAERLTR